MGDYQELKEDVCKVVRTQYTFLFWVYAAIIASSLLTCLGGIALLIFYAILAAVVGNEPQSPLRHY